MSDRYWLLLEKSDETRISKGIDGYRDKTGESYHYDSLVPNHKQLGVGDFVVLRVENEILGVGRIADISQTPDTKVHRRCPDCRSTDIRERTTKTPRWKCGACAFEFVVPDETTIDVQSFTASIADFAQLNSPPSVKAVKYCAAGGDGNASQLSILELDQIKIQALLEGITPSLPTSTTAIKSAGQGFGLSPAERRAIELRAMQIARQLYESQNWKVVDTSESRPYDLHAVRDQEQRFIEVKGTTGEGCSVILTAGEVKHAQEHERSSALVVVSGIILTEDDGLPIASGGEVSTHLDPWVIDEMTLAPTEFRYWIRKI